MIKFFRHIRKDLMEKNKTGKYFKYAIGEIVLVVIGILIALSINNWNEQRKDGQFEHKMLSEIRTSISKDLEFFKQLNGDLDRKNNAINTVILAQRDTSKKYSESLARFIPSIFLGIQFGYDKGSYETIKSLGIDKITSDTLRNKITRYYEVTIPKTSGLIDYLHNYYNPKMFKNEEELINANLTYFNIVNQTDSTFALSRGVNLDKFLSDPLFKKSLINEMRMSEEYRNSLLPLIDSAEEMIKEINLEIEKGIN